MQINYKTILAAGAVIGLIYYLGRKAITDTVGAIGDATGTVVKGVNKFVEAATFDEKDLGPSVESLRTEEANLSRDEYIRLGYMAKDAHGYYRLTPAGEEYIARQRALYE